jgi:hypothetical protein
MRIGGINKVFYKSQLGVAMEIKQTQVFQKWREQLKDQKARALVASRLWACW